MKGKMFMICLVALVLILSVTALRTKTFSGVFKINGYEIIINEHNGAALKIIQQGDASASTSVGGAINLDNTLNKGAGMILYTNSPYALGNLVGLRSDNPSFNKNLLHINYEGVADSISILHKGTGRNSNALTVSSLNDEASTVGISGVEKDRGTVKVTHTGSGDDASAAVLSLALVGDGTAAQGVFLKGETTGKLIHLINNDEQQFIVTAEGDLIIRGSFKTYTPSGKIVTCGVGNDLEWKCK